MRINIITFQLFLITFLTALCGTTYAQDSPAARKFYIETSGGYGFALVSDDLGSTNDLIGITDRLIRPDSSISISPVHGTQGPGWQFGLNFGYMFHPNIGVELQATYLKSNSYLLGRNNTPTYQAEHTVVGQRVDLIPQLVFNFSFKEKWSVYSKSGLVIPVWGKSMSSVTVDDQEGRLVQEVLGIPNPDTHASVRIKASTYGKFSYGFQTRLGVGYSILDWLHVFAETKFMALSIRSKEDRIDELNITLFNSNGGNPYIVTEDDLTEIDLRTIYVSELTENSNNPMVNNNSDPNRPMEELNKRDNFNQLAILFGLRFYIK